MNDDEYLNPCTSPKGAIRIPPKGKLQYFIGELCTPRFISTNVYVWDTHKAKGYLMGLGNEMVLFESLKCIYITGCLLMVPPNPNKSTHELCLEYTKKQLKKQLTTFSID